MRKSWRAGVRSRGICEHCSAVVDTRFEYRTYPLDEPRVDVPDVLVAVCTGCDRTVAVPFQSSPQLNAARGAAAPRAGSACGRSEPHPSRLHSPFLRMMP